MRTQFLPTVGVAAAAALFAGAAYLYTVRISRRSGGGFTIGTVPSRAAKQPLGRQEEPKEEDPKPRVDVYFGSQTGTAEDFAKQVQREGNARGLDMNVVDLELYDKARISSGTAVFLVATYGEGEPTDNGRDFHDWVTCEEDETALSGLNFAVFGLGNSQYEHFNSFGKAVDRHVARLGGKRLLNLALGDDDNDLRDAFEDWLDKVRPEAAPNDLADVRAAREPPFPAASPLAPLEIRTERFLLCSKRSYGLPSRTTSGSTSRACSARTRGCSTTTRCGTSTPPARRPRPRAPRLGAASRTTCSMIPRAWSSA